ncbi:phosphoglycerate mutase-like protein 4 isoform X2 [Ricinus communis]|uniref:phosphoglycerate mutase-like protein 4 isoform X2 n=1 Tax=Ricinus communis TaxID=3988 RepID=UPI000772243D|nr:phosphoglycerate mutase-like protein 4 isoform X2 [Ricinus communis]|eukprot:XP_015576717.1 phosphoglycerate mutase-like protein 4 isoform X2 [Ricinus communis]
MAELPESNPSSTRLPYTEIIVVRHGETEWNANGRLQGHLDVELNDAGRQQAALVADRLSKEHKISAVYSSDLKRALVTAEIIAASCGGLEVIKDADLRERHLGDLQGLVLQDAARVSPQAYQAFINRRTNQDIPLAVERVSINFISEVYLLCKEFLGSIEESELLWLLMGVSLGPCTGRLAPITSLQERF